MTNLETKACRHCGEAILVVARICKHCQSNQAWFGSPRDARFHLLVLLIVLPFVFLPLVMLNRSRTKLNRAIRDDTSCRGLVVVKERSYQMRTIEGRDRLYVRVQLENRSKVDVSDPVIRIEIANAGASVADTFTRTVYGENIPASQPYWVRVDGEITIDPTTIKDVRASVASADCKPAWE